MSFLAGLQNRERIPELMDDPALDPAEHRSALEGLAQLNRYSRSIGILWPTIRALSRKLDRPLRVLDVATGSGDIPKGLIVKALRSGLRLDVAGCDISSTAIATARTNCPDGLFFVHDAIRQPLPSGYDVLTCSLFLHHLSNHDAILLLSRLKEATDQIVLVNDLVRSRFNYLSVSLACRFFTRSRVVQYDGPASVRSAYTIAEASELAQQAGFHGAIINQRFPCRFLLSWEKP